MLSETRKEKTKRTLSLNFLVLESLRKAEGTMTQLRGPCRKLERSKQSTLPSVYTAAHLCGSQLQPLPVLEAEIILGDRTVVGALVEGSGRKE